MFLLSGLLQLQFAWSCGPCGLLNANRMSNPDPRPNLKPRLSIGIHMWVRLVPRTKKWLEPCCGSFVFPLAWILQLQCGWRFEVCGFLSPNPRSNLNPRHIPNLRLSIGICMGVRIIPGRKLGWELCCGRFVFPLSGLLQLHFAWSYMLVVYWSLTLGIALSLGCALDSAWELD